MAEVMRLVVERPGLSVVEIDDSLNMTIGQTCISSLRRRGLVSTDRDTGAGGRVRKARRPTPDFWELQQQVADDAKVRLDDRLSTLFEVAVDIRQELTVMEPDTEAALHRRVFYLGSAAALAEVYSFNSIQWFPGFEGWKLIISAQALAPERQEPV